MAASLFALICVGFFGATFAAQVYNSQTNVCCNGYTYPLSQGASQCCDRSAYDPGTQICCNGAIQNKYVNGDITRQLTCCGASPVEMVAGSVCCGGQLVDAPFDPNSNFNYAIFYGCCQYQSYNVLTQKCCNGIVAPIDGSADACCAGAGFYDSNVQACCNGRLSPLPSGTTVNTFRCCDTVAYNPRVQVCCPDDIDHPNKATGRLLEITRYTNCTNCEYKCCGNKVIVTQEELCCNNQPIKVTKVDVAYAIGGYYKSSSAMCCNGGDAKGVIMDASKQACCNNGVMNKTMGSQLCCADKLYDSTVAICCGNEIVNSSFLIPWACCNGRKYNRDVKICCGNQLYPKTFGVDSCCMDPQ